MRASGDEKQDLDNKQCLFLYELTHCCYLHFSLKSMFPRYVVLADHARNSTFSFLGLLNSDSPSTCCFVQIFASEIKYS